MRQLTIDPIFRDKIPPLTPDEYSRLEENILEDGEVREPIVVWGNTIIDGHNRYKIMQDHPEIEIPFRVKQMDFSDKWEAIVWMCRNQLGRRNLTDGQRTIIIGEAYKAQKLSSGGDRRSEKFSKDQNDLLKKYNNTAQKIADDFGVAEMTVKRAENFLDGLAAAEEVSPGIKDAVLTGEVKAPKSTIAAIRNIPEEDRPAAVEAIKSWTNTTAKRIAKPPEEDDRPPYNVEDFRGDLMAAVDAFEFAMNQHMGQAHCEKAPDKKSEA